MVTLYGCEGDGVHEYCILCARYLFENTNECPFRRGVCKVREAITSVYRALAHAHNKFGVQDWPNGTGPDRTISPAFFQNVVEEARSDGTLTWKDILMEEVAEAFYEGDPVDLYDELAQVAAVAVRWMDNISRNGWDG